MVELWINGLSKIRQKIWEWVDLKNPNEFIDYLTDTIVLTQSNDPEKTMGMLVAGKGLVWFTDSDGIRWTLKE